MQETAPAVVEEHSPKDDHGHGDQHLPALPSIPLALFHEPGVVYDKISSQGIRAMKSRQLWLEVNKESKVSSSGELLLCWQKSFRGVSFRQQSIPFSHIKEVRLKAEGSFYRESLHIRPDVEPRWITIVYVEPSSLSSARTAGNIYKYSHWVAKTDKDYQNLSSVLLAYSGGKAKDAGAAIHEAVCCGTVHMEDPNREIDLEEILNLVDKLGLGLKKEKVEKQFHEKAAPNKKLNFTQFQEFVNILKHRNDLEVIFNEMSLGKDHINQLEWIKFMKTYQGSDFSDEKLLSIMKKYCEPGPTLEMKSLGFFAFLISSDNLPLKDESDMDFTQPLQDYYINTSHNTYLVGNQLQGESTIEGYIKALQRGCRSVELDVWDGGDGMPIVTHGRTLTRDLQATEAFGAVAKYGFLGSNLPLLLNIETHLSVEQQEKLVEIMIKAFGDRLLTRRIDNEDGPITMLPSPKALEGRVLVKTKDKFLAAEILAAKAASNLLQDPSMVDASDSSTTASESSASTQNRFSFRRIREAISGSSPTNTVSSPSALPTSSSSSSQLQIPVHSPSGGGSLLQRVRSRSSSRLKGRPPPLVSTSSSSSSAEIMKSPKFSLPMSQAYANLMVYTKGVKGRGFNKKETYDVTHFVSVGESKFLSLIKDEANRLDVISHCRTHLLRTYPKAFRLTSSNYHPHNMWMHGVQLAALNYQNLDMGMRLNLAMFSRAGKQGYILKPKILRMKNPELKDKEAFARKQAYTLKVTVISAQQLPRLKDDARVDPFVEVQLWIPSSDPQPGIAKRSKVVMGNSFNPEFNTALQFNFDLCAEEGMLDLAFLNFKVMNAKGNADVQGETDDEDYMGGYCISLGALQQGFRYLPLYDSLGDQHLFSTLLIKSFLTPKVPTGLPPTNETAA